MDQHHKLVLVTTHHVLFARVSPDVPKRNLKRAAAELDLRHPQLGMELGEVALN
jgi:hypothetical protein